MPMTTILVYPPVVRQRAAGFENLFDDLAAGKIALKTQKRGGAKGTAISATDLSRNTQG